MRIRLIPTEEFTQINKLQEVTSPVLFERGGVPHPNGLISNEIFGVNVKSRKETFAYIDLGGYFFSPHIYKVFKRIFRNIEKIISGEQYYSIDSNGLLVKDDNGETGLDFIYKNWDKIRWERTQGMRNERIDILTKTPKSEIFMRYQIVIPAFYRDIYSSQGGGGSTSELNNLYSYLIRQSSIIKNESQFDFSFNVSRYNIQNCIIDIYDFFRNKLNKKEGLFRKYLLGKNVDYASRLVISAPSFHANRPEDMIIDFDNTGVPISACCSMVYLHIVHWLKNFFNEEFVNNKFNKPVYNAKTKEVDKYIQLKNPENYFNDRYIKKAIDLYIEDPESRFNRIELPIVPDPENPDQKYYLRFTGKYYNPSYVQSSSALIDRDMTWTDLLFMAAVDATRDKHIVVTRYPLLDYFGLFINKIRVTSTLETIPVEVNGIVYKWYPKIDSSLPKSRVSTNFIDTLQFSNSYLAGLDGDYDGDQVTCKILWTQEANEEAERIMRSKPYILNINGANVRRIENEAIQTLYVLTKDPK